MSLSKIVALLETDSISITVVEDTRRRDQIRRLTEGVRFTGKFIVTYQAVLSSVVLFFSIWHAYEKVSKARRAARIRGYAVPRSDGSVSVITRRDMSYENGRSSSGLSSSGSSTLEGNVTPPEPMKTPDDRTPLLSTEPGAKRPPTPYLLMRSILMYQPPPIPIDKKTLPENTTTLLILCLLGLNIFYILYNIQWETSMMFIWSDRTALCFAANLPWLYFLGAKNQPLRLLTGYSYEHLNILHRRLGEWLCFIALLHTGSMFVVWYYFFLPTGRSLWWFLTEKTVYLGLITLACYEVLYVTSLASFRKWWYELFLGLHVFLQAGALGFLYFHHPGSRTYVLITLVIFLVDRLIFRFALKTRSVRADLKVMEDGNTVMISANWPLVSHWSSFWTSIFGRNMFYAWNPAEHIFLTVPALGRKHTIQAHPFTVASAAPEGDQPHAWFNLVIRALDGFTRDLLVYAQSHSSVSVRLDGPYGSMHALDMLRASEVAILVAGGSGIAVAYPMLWSLLQDRSRDTESAIRGQRVCLVWIVHEAGHLSWLGQERLEELKQMGLHLVLPPPTSKAGRPDVAALLRVTIDELMSDKSVGARTGVMVSGPDGINRATRNTCSYLAWEGRDVTVTVEKFGW